MNQLKNFVVNHSQTNFIVMCVPYRHDLDPNSCINDEVKVYNRKLKKYLKVCENTQIIEIDSNREQFTKHGLHLNLKGKDQIARKIVQTIKVMLNRKMSDPIMLKDNEELRIHSEVTERIAEVTQIEVKEAHLIHEDQVRDTQDQTEDKLPSKRARKPLTTRHEDFLWLDRKTKH